MVFNMKQAFKLLTFVWGDYDGEKFVKSGFWRTSIPKIWMNFQWAHLVCNEKLSLCGYAFREGGY